jgi:hypothetical protein
MRRTLILTFSLLVAAALLVGCDSASPALFDADPPAGAQASDRGSVERRAPAGVGCPCFTARDLTRPMDAGPEPYLFFDTFNWWGLDYRRTELRSTLTVDGTAVERVASVYITPGTPGSHFALICHRQDVERSPDGDGFDYVYVTHEPGLEAAEACRQAIYAAASGVECQGPACGLAYEKGQLYPDYPAYDNGRSQLRLHTSLERTIAAVRSLIRADA